VNDALAARAAAEPFFLASALAAYQQRHGLHDAALAARARWSGLLPYLMGQWAGSGGRWE
jgi:hypothetical protein